MVDQNNSKDLHQAIESMFFAYRNFTAQPDKILANKGLNRIHHRILYFVGKNPGTSVGNLIAILKITKQALHAPLRQLLEMQLVRSESATVDRRSRCLSLTDKGKKLEQQLTSVQCELLAKAFSQSAGNALENWMQVMQSIAKED